MLNYQRVHLPVKNGRTGWIPVTNGKSLIGKYIYIYIIHVYIIKYACIYSIYLYIMYFLVGTWGFSRFFIPGPINPGLLAFCNSIDHQWSPQLGSCCFTWTSWNYLGMGQNWVYTTIMNNNWMANTKIDLEYVVPRSLM